MFQLTVMYDVMFMTCTGGACAALSAGGGVASDRMLANKGLFWLVGLCLPGLYLMIGLSVSSCGDCMLCYNCYTRRLLARPWRVQPWATATVLATFRGSAIPTSSFLYLYKEEERPLLSNVFVALYAPLLVCFAMCSLRLRTCRFFFLFWN